MALIVRIDAKTPIMASNGKVTQMLRFRFGFEKKVQAAAVVLRGRGHMDRLRLLKILYIADREALSERGVPILGGRAVAMDHGPLHSDVYNAIKGTSDREADWSQFIANEGHTVVLKNDPGRMKLSPYEIEKLKPSNCDNCPCGDPYCPECCECNERHSLATWLVVGGVILALVFPFVVTACFGSR